MTLTARYRMEAFATSLVLLALPACHAEPPTADNGAFMPIGQYDVADGEAEMACADLDGDGHRDVAIVSSARGELHILRGDGAGRLTVSEPLDAGRNPTDIAAADINGDGRIDLVIANHETHHLTLLLGDGTGDFQPAGNSPFAVAVEPHPHTVRVADIDADGLVDLIVDHRQAGALLIHRGLGAGAFETNGRVIDVGGDPYLGMIIADINGDGRPDLVTPGPASVEVTLSTAPDGLGFSRAPAVPALSPFAVALADMDGDGIRDVIAAAERADLPVQVHLGLEGGRFVEKPALRLSMSAGAKKIATGDFDHDGFGDAVVGSWSGDLRLIRGGRGELAARRLQHIGVPWGMLACDLDGDQRSELLIADGVAARLDVLVYREQ